MGMIFASAAGLMLMAAGPVSISQGNVEQSAQIHCPAKYPDNFAMQAACRRNYLDGASAIREIAARYRDVPAMQAALRRCLDRYRDDMALVRYSIAAGCARNQEQGWQEMRR